MAEEIKNNEQNVTVEETKVEPMPKVESPKAEGEIDAQAQIQNMMVELARLKRANDKLSSENADVKRKYKATLSEQEQASMEKAERELEREEQFKSLLRENNINKTEKSYLALGFNADEASKIAVAEVDGDFEAKLQIMALVDARKKKEYEAEWLKTRPSVNSGNGNESTNITKAQFDAMGYTERVQFKNKYPETYKQFTS